MPSRSQRHLRETRRVDSAGNDFFPGPRPAPNFAITRNLGARTLTVTGGPSNFIRSIEITYKVNEEETPIHVYASVTNGNSLSVIATSIATAINTRADFTATANAGVVTLVDGEDTDSVEVLEAAIH